MISIIICSRAAEPLAIIRDNISRTISTEYEIIAIDNSQGKYSLCSAYNKGADQAKFDILCFMHEDVSFETEGWGKNLVQHLSDPMIGLVGIAGGDTKSAVPSSWSSFIFTSEINLVQHYKKDGRKERIRSTGYPDSPVELRPVACIDGVFMCTRKDVFRTFRFDEKTFTAFHGYDIDYSLQVGTQYKIVVVFDILLHHFSEGSFNREWLHYSRMLSDKWKEKLPVSARVLPREKFVHQHWTAMRVYLWRMIDLEYGLREIILSFFKYSFNRYFHLLNFLHFFKIIIMVKVAGSRSAFKKLIPNQ